MPQDLIPATTLITAVLSTFAAILAGISAFMSFRLARRIQQELQSDERLIAGTPDHPELPDQNHKSCVLRTAIFNKSKRKGYIDSVQVFDETGTKLEVSWSDSIDRYGNPQHPSHLIGVVDMATLFVRTNTGQPILTFARIEIGHCFSKKPLTVIFEPFASWNKVENG